MNGIRRWLAFTFSRTLRTVEPTRIHSTFDLQNADERSRALIMYLAHDDAALVMHQATFTLLGVLAIADGGWEPLGTDAGPVVWRSAFGVPNEPTAERHYLPNSQLIADGDARAFAGAIRRALRTERLDWIGAEPRRVPYTWAFAERWNYANMQYQAPALAREWRVHDKAETVAAFLDGGACRIVAGLPKKVHDDDAERERVEKLAREARRLEAELADSPASKLARLRGELAEVNTNA